MRGRALGAIRRRAWHRPRARLRDSHETFDIPRWPLGWILLAAASVLAGKSFVSAASGPFDLVIATHGRLLPPAGMVVIHPRESGTIRAVNVRDGQEIRQGDVLLRVASTATAETIDRLQRERDEAALDMLRLAAQELGDPRALRAPADAEPGLVERARWLLASRMQAQQAHVTRLRRSIARDRARRAEVLVKIALLETRVLRLSRHVAVEEALVKRHFVSVARLTKVAGEFAIEFDKQAELARQLAETDTQIAVAAGMLGRAAAEFHARTLAERAAATRRFEAASLALERKNRELRDLRAPTNGVVRRIAVLAEGNVVSAAEPLLRILPADVEFEVEALLPNHDIGWIVEGQRVALRLAPFKPGNPMEVDGKVTWTARDPVEDARLGPVYPVRIRIARQSRPDPELVAALAARAETPLTADIRLGARSWLDLLVQTLLRQRAGSGTSAATQRAGTGAAQSAPSLPRTSAMSFQTN